MDNHAMMEKIDVKSCSSLLRLQNNFSNNSAVNELSLIIGEEDLISQRLLKSFQGHLLEDYSPRKVIGDGNCFYRCLSLAIFGHEEEHLYMRLLTAIEIIINRKYYDIDDKFYSSNKRISDERISTTDYNHILNDALMVGGWAQMMHLYASSAALGKAFQSYRPF
ncbi:uncharacterized protein LOC135922197 [Gordionus sp. m RMFG-2023]|uniref:uncharacterized protein LOC135922197 n=1 Tax=Gordionus sp. m RMFG-2023 TaxID=3053472 RepID=UPI0031FDFC15